MTQENNKSLIVSKAMDDYKRAENRARLAEEELVQAISEFEGEPYGNERNGFSKIVKRTIAKTVMKVIPVVTEPFSNTDKPIRIKRNINGAKLDFWEDYLNDFLTEKQDIKDLVEEFTKNLLLAPRAWIMPIWETKTRNGKIISKGKLISPSSSSIRIDPKATSEEDAEFFTYEERVALNDLYAEALQVEGANLSTIRKRRDNNYETVSANLSLDERINGTNEKDDGSHVKIVRYYGFIPSEEKDNFSTDYYEIVWIQGEQKEIYKRKTDAPFNRIPIHGASFSSGGAGIYGKSLAWFLSDAQRIETGIARGMLDNINEANNGTTFVNQNSSPETIMALKAGRKIVPIGKKDDISHGNFNQIPQTVFQFGANIDKEVREISGVMFNSPTVSRSQMSEDGGGQTLTIAQSQILSTIRKTGQALKESCKDIMMFASWYTPLEERIRMAGGEEFLSVFMNLEEIGFKRQVGTADSARFEAGQINMLLQQSVANGDIISKDVRKGIIVSLFEALGKDELADRIELDEEESNPMQDLQAQLAMQEQSAKIAKITAETQALNTKAGYDSVKAQNDSMRLSLEEQKVQADSYKKRAEGDHTSVKTAKATADAVQEISSGIVPNEGIK